MYQTRSDNYYDNEYMENKQKDSNTGVIRNTRVKPRVIRYYVLYIIRVTHNT